MDSEAHRTLRDATKFVHKKQCVLSLDLNVGCDGLDRILTGKEFHTVGEVKQKDRLAKSDSM